MGLGIGSWFLEQLLFDFWNSFFLISGIVSFWFLEQLLFDFWNSLFYCSSFFLFCSNKSEKKPLAVFIIILVFIKKSLLYPTFRRKKILLFVEKLLRHPTFRRKTENESCFQKTENVFRKPRNVRSVIFRSNKDKYNYTKNLTIKVICIIILSSD